MNANNARILWQFMKGLDRSGNTILQHDSIEYIMDRVEEDIVAMEAENQASSGTARRS